MGVFNGSDICGIGCHSCISNTENYEYIRDMQPILIRPVRDMSMRYILSQTLHPSCVKMKNEECSTLFSLEK